MIVKIRFPNPSDGSDVKDWFEQMELSLFHAKKSYEKMSKTVTNKDDIGIYFTYPSMNHNKEFEKILNEEIISYEDSQDIELHISY